MLESIVCQSCQSTVDVSAEDDNPSCPQCGQRVRRGAVTAGQPAPPISPGVSDPRAVATARLESLRAATAYTRTRTAIGWLVLVGFFVCAGMLSFGLMLTDVVLLVGSVVLGIVVVALGLLCLVLVDIADALVRR